MKSDLQQYLDIFHALKSEYSSDFQTHHGLQIKSGEGMEAAILKLLKPTWTTDSAEEILNTNGLFFSVWVDEECKAKGIVRYNLHAKKLRFIKGETFAARDFVRHFRLKAKTELAQWPNCTYPKGPITLFEGNIPLRADSLKSDTAKLMEKFAALTPMLDRLLAG